MRNGLLDILIKKGLQMNRKRLLILCAVLAVVNFLIFYAMFFYNLGAAPKGASVNGASIVYLLYYSATVIVTLFWARDRYDNKLKSIIFAVIWGIPFIIIISLLSTGGEILNGEILAIIISVLSQGLIFLISLCTIFMKEKKNISNETTAKNE